MNVRVVMTALPITVSRTSTIADAASAMRASGVSMLPVVDAAGTMSLCGVLTDRDIVERCMAAGHGGACVVSDHMTAGPLETATADDDIETVVKRMDTARVNRLPVVDAAGRVVGVVTRHDIFARSIGV